MVDNYSVAYGVNADGSVVVGYSGSTGIYHAFRWTSAGMVDLLTLPGGTSAVANGVSADGAVVVGLRKPRSRRGTAAASGRTPGRTGASADGG